MVARRSYRCGHHVLVDDFGADSAVLRFERDPGGTLQTVRPSQLERAAPSGELCFDRRLAHCPSGRFQANAAGDVLATIAHNLIRWIHALGPLAVYP